MVCHKDQFWDWFSFSYVSMILITGCIARYENSLMMQSWVINLHMKMNVYSFKLTQTHWAHEWQMNFKSDKCKVLHIGRKKQATL